MDLPDSAKQHLVSEVVALFAALPPRREIPSVLPLTVRTLATVLEDSQLVDGTERLTENLLTLSRVAEPGSFLRNWSSAREQTAVILEQLDYVQTFNGVGSRYALAVRDAVFAALLVALKGVSGDCDEVSLNAAAQKTRDRVQELEAAAKTALVEDRCMSALGVASSDAVDVRGVFSRSRVLAAYYGRYDELARRVDTLLSVLNASSTDLPAALYPAEALAMSPRPLLTLRTAVRVGELLRAGLADDVEAVAAPLRELKLRADRAATSHAGLVRTLEAANKADTAEERAIAALDAYRRATEGQLRAWAWALLRLLGRTGRKPEISRLRDQLLASRDPLLEDAAALLHLSARNAAAHEDFEWDDSAGLLRVGDSEVEPDELLDMVDAVYSFVAGAEAAWRCARLENAEFARLLDVEDRPGGPRALRSREAVTHFGTNGLRVRGWTHESDTFTVAVDDVPFRLINPCFQAVMWASRVHTAVPRFVVFSERHQCVAVDLGRAPLDATFELWNLVVGRFEEGMPLSTFLPANVATRMAVEEPEQAAAAASWHSLNDAVHAYNETLEFGDAETRRVLGNRLALAANALQMTSPLLPERQRKPLETTMLLLAEASRSVRSRSVEASRLEQRIRTLHLSSPSASVLPTVDPTPLDQIGVSDK